MNFQQLRYVRETVRRQFNLTEAARALHTSQPGVSRQIRELELELGVDIFERRGRRFVGLTLPGRELLPVIERVLAEAQNLKRVGEEHSAPGTGRLVVATTHTQARYMLPPVVAAYRKQLPKVRLSLQQGSPTAIAQMVIRGEADLAIATESLDHYDELLALPAYQWSHAVVVPAGHPLTRRRRLALADLAAWPVVTYSTEFAGRSRIDQTFAAAGLELDVVLTAIDSDVIKTYVQLGLGIGIIASVAFDAHRDRGLRRLSTDAIFPVNTTRVAIRRDRHLRAVVAAFIEAFAPELTPDRVKAALATVHEHRSAPDGRPAGSGLTEDAAAARKA
jgi:LysR family cys regulon transcriptional activator